MDRVICVRKFDDSIEPYDRQKVVTFCQRMGVSDRDAEAVADKVEARLYDEIPTKKIIQLARRYLKRYQPVVGLRRDLRSAISLLRSKPDWELFVHGLMKAVGYEVEGNKVLRGKCVDNEIDGVLRRQSETLMLEVKHHRAPHTKTGLDIPREVWATYVDLTEGFHLAYHDIDFTGALIVCNTKFSTVGQHYARCRGVETLSWKTPLDRGVEALIEAEWFYPITLVRDVDRRTAAALADGGILLLTQLVDADLRQTSRNTGLKRSKLEQICTTARKIVPDY